METLIGRLALVACGGGLGAVARYGLDAWVGSLWPSLAVRFPLGIMLVNVVGCLLFGVVVGVAGGIEALSPGRRFFVLTGLLGGFTTFSAFGSDTARLLGAGQPGMALLNAAGSVILGVAAVFAGLRLGNFQ